MIEIAAARQAADGQQSKMDLVYRYLTGPRFGSVLRQSSKFAEMQEDLNRERSATVRLWAKRDAQLRTVIQDGWHVRHLQGIAGTALDEIDGSSLAVTEQRDGEGPAGKPTALAGFSYRSS